MADSVQDIGRGVLQVSTPSHGGTFVPDSELAKLPECLRRFKTFTKSPNWFEEDCDVVIPVLMFPDLFEGWAVQYALTAVKNEHTTGYYAKRGFDFDAYILTDQGVAANQKAIEASGHEVDTALHESAPETARPEPELDEFTRGYLMAAFWTNDDDAPSGCDYSTTDRFDVMFSKLHPAAVDEAAKDCKAFQTANSELLAQAGDASRNGGDFWLTRNHHGCGFWDRDYSDEVGDGLTKAAHKFGEVDLYAGDDGRLYFSR